jgi:hypothetical protein
MRRSDRGTRLGFLHPAEPDVLLVAGGAYRWSADQLARYRVAVNDERTGAHVQRLLATAAGM